MGTVHRRPCAQRRGDDREIPESFFTPPSNQLLSRLFCDDDTEYVGLMTAHRPGGQISTRLFAGTVCIGGFLRAGNWGGGIGGAVPLSGRPSPVGSSWALRVLPTTDSNTRSGPASGGRGPGFPKPFLLRFWLRFDGKSARGGCQDGTVEVAGRRRWKRSRPVGCWRRSRKWTRWWRSRRRPCASGHASPDFP